MEIYSHYVIYSPEKAGYKSFDEGPHFIWVDSLMAACYTLSSAKYSIIYNTNKYPNFPKDCIIRRIDYSISDIPEIDRPEQLGAIVFNQI